MSVGSLSRRRAAFARQISGTLSSPDNVIFIGILYYFLNQPLKDYLANRSATIVPFHSQEGREPSRA